MTGCGQEVRDGSLRETARDEAQHGKAFKGLPVRCFWKQRGFQEVWDMTLGDILLIFGAALVVLAFVGWLMNRRKPEKAKDSDKVLENVADLNDRFNRARYQDENGK